MRTRTGGRGRPVIVYNVDSGRSSWLFWRGSRGLRRRCSKRRLHGKCSRWGFGRARRGGNGFLLATPPGPTGRGWMGESPGALEDVGVEVFWVEKELWRMNSQSSARTTRIRKEASITRGVRTRLRFSTPKTRPPVQAIQEPRGNGLEDWRIQASCELQGWRSTGKRTKTWQTCTPLWGGRSFSGSR